ncbi:MAG: PAS domain S-box protein [Victivallales bacterium]|nr:PAS domain S-box protein [Victivallales bacterium]
MLKRCCARFLACLYFIPLMAFTCAGEQENQPAPPRILILNSYHQGFHWTNELVTAALNELKKIQPEPEIFIEYMDCKRFPKCAEDGRWDVFLERKYRHLHPDLIIVSDDIALTFMKKYRDKLFPGVPVIFCGINDTASALNVPENFTGIIETLDIPANLRLAKKLFPAVNTIAVITDNTTTGAGARREIMETAKDFPELKFIYLNGEDLTMQELINAMKKLPANSVALAPAWYKDRSGQVYTNTESYPIISVNCPVPVISTSASNMGLGLFGGKVNSGETQGGYAAQVARQILMDKINISRIPVETGSRNMYMFDARQLARFNVSESKLPPGSRVLYRPFSFYKTYRLLVWAVIIIFIILMTLVSVLAAEVIIRKRTAAELAESRNILSEVINTIPLRIFWKDLNFKYLGCNQLFARDAGRSSPEYLIGDDDYNLVWKDQAEAFQATDREVIQNGLPKLNYEEQQLLANGKEIWVCTSKVPMHDAKGKICGVLGILQDISERKLNEQCASPRKLDNLNRCKRLLN